MSDNQDKPQTRTISVEGFHAFSNPLDNNSESIEHRKEQLTVEYRTMNIRGDHSGPDSIWIEAYISQYDIRVVDVMPSSEAKSIYEAANKLIYAELSEEPYKADNIELVNGSDVKEYWIYQLRMKGYKAAVRSDRLPDESKDILGENEMDYFFCDGSLKEGDKVVVGSYHNPDENKYTEITSKCRHQSGRDKWNFRYLDESEVDAGENKDGDS